LYGIKVNILRVSNPYGNRQRVETAQGAVAVFLSRAIQGQPIEIWGDGSVSRDYLYVGDVADAFAKAVNYDGINSVFNISSGQGTTLNELIALIEKALGTSVLRNYRPGRTFDVPVSVLDNTLARAEMGWSPTISLEEGILRTESYMRRLIET
jgi:UDP-glucose 4-epimerase